MSDLGKMVDIIDILVKNQKTMAENQLKDSKTIELLSIIVKQLDERIDKLEKPPLYPSWTPRAD